MQKMAERIRARAVRRCGILLRQISDKETAGRPKKNRKDGLTISRAKAARDAGLSVHQKRTALRVAKIPQEQFDEAVESKRPPTVEALARQGRDTSAPHLHGRNAADFTRSTDAQKDLRRLFETAERVTAKVAVRGALDPELSDMLKHAKRISIWLDALIFEIQEAQRQ